MNSLTAFNNRYYDSTTGRDAAEWIFDKLIEIAGGKFGITVTKFIHDWAQFSVIVRIDGTSASPVTILGCHLDSINPSDPMDGRAPGADDVRFVLVSESVAKIY